MASRGVGGVGTRLAGYSRGGGAGSRRWMALTGNRLLKQHDISWNESTHTHTHTHTSGTHPRFHAHKLAFHPLSPALSLPSPHTSVFWKPPCPAQTCRFHLQFVDSVCATPGFIYVANYFVFSISTCLFLPPIFYPLSLKVSPNQTPLMNHEADIRKKSSINVSGGSVPNLCGVTRYLTLRV